MDNYITKSNIEYHQQFHIVIIRIQRAQINLKRERAMPGVQLIVYQKVLSGLSGIYIHVVRRIQNSHHPSKI